MIHEYSRTELLLGKDGLEKLRSASVMVFGVGGVGSHCIEALARSGVGKLILIDNDTVSLTNINRQSIAYHSTVGKYKTKVMEERIRDICPEIQVVTYELFVLPDNLETLFTEKVDYIIDAIDIVTAKLDLITIAKELNIPIISSMGTGNKINPTMLEIADITKTSVCPLAKVMRAELKKRRIQKVKVLFSRELPMKPKNLENNREKQNNVGSISFVPSVAGLIIASEVIKDITALKNLGGN